MSNSGQQQTSPIAGQRARRGVTLIELLVTITVMVVIMGLALEIMTETERSTRKMTRQQSTIQYCQHALQQASASIGAAVPPANVTGLKNPAPLQPRFEKNAISFVAFSPDKDPYLSQVTIGLHDEEGTPAVIRRETHPIAETATRQQTVKDQVETLGAGLPESAEPSIRFGYASTPEPGKMPVYQDSWSSQSWPALVQITVKAKLRDDAAHPIELQTAVIPGLLPPGTAMAMATTAATTGTTATLPVAAQPTPAQAAPVQATPSQPVVATPPALTPTPALTPAGPTPTVTPTGTPTPTPTPQPPVPVITPAAPVKTTPDAAATPAQTPVPVLSPDGALKEKHASLMHSQSARKEARA